MGRVHDRQGRSVLELHDRQGECREIAWSADIYGKELGAATTEDFDRRLKALLVSPFELITAALPGMRSAGGGRIILLTSAVADKPLGEIALYVAARTGARALAAAAAKQLGPENILLNSIGPNFFENPTYFPPGILDADPQVRATVENDVPLRRLATEQEMGALIAFLASGKAAPITGQYIGFAGGWLP